MNIIHGDCLEKLKELDDNSVDSIVTDPPYGLSFMGKKWDYDVPSQEIWEECLRVLKPGGYLLAFAGTRTQHRMAVRIEDAGFEIRDMIAWCYGSGFPKSLDVSKAIDKAAGAEREVVGRETTKWTSTGRNKTYGKLDYFETNGGKYEVREMTAPATEAAKQWQGWGTALKPALEPITVARKPISEKTVAENVLKYGTGGINIDGCRVKTEDKMSYSSSQKEGVTQFGTGTTEQSPLNRFPANFIHDGSDEVVGLFPDTKSQAGVKNLPTSNIYGGNSLLSSKTVGTGRITGFTDSGSASRFFYCAKASKSERNKGCEELEEKVKVFNGQSSNPSEDMKGVERKFTTQPSKNNHPTVKPISLMRYLCRLVTPKGGTVLDPFMGSGTTGIGAKLEGFDFIGIEREEEYIKIAEARINAWEAEKQKKLI